jgi:hypothetical protein
METTAYGVEGCRTVVLACLMAAAAFSRLPRINFAAITGPAVRTMAFPIWASAGSRHPS